MSPDEGQEELEEVQAEIKKKDEEVNQHFTILSLTDQTGQYRSDSESVGTNKHS